jgi:integrase
MDSIKYLDTMGIEALFSVAKGRDRLILLCLYDLGGRVGELVTTRVSDIDFQNGFIRIQSSKTKTGNFRAARASHATLEAIKESIQPGQEWRYCLAEAKAPEHQDGAEDHRPPGKGGRDPGGLTPERSSPARRSPPISSGTATWSCL